MGQFKVAFECGMFLKEKINLISRRIKVTILFGEGKFIVVKMK